MGAFRKTIAVVGALALYGAPLVARAEDPGIAGNGRPLTEPELQSIGCIASGGIATLTASAIGTSEIMAIIAGGAVASTNPMVTATAAGALIFASFCTVGQAAMPALLLGAEKAEVVAHSSGLDDRIGQAWASLRQIDVTGAATWAGSVVASAVDSAVDAVGTVTVATAHSTAEEWTPLVRGLASWREDADSEDTQVAAAGNLHL